MSTGSPGPAPEILLVDNGSLEPAAILSLRRIAAALASALGKPVHPVSLLHSSAVDPSRLDGLAAEILEPALNRRLAAGGTDFLIVPLFIGPSAALTRYLPERLAAIRNKHSGMMVRVAKPLVDGSDASVAALAAVLEAQVRKHMAGVPDRPAVVVVDHGSPVPEVVAVRDQVTARLRQRLGPDAREVVASSMERRDGPEYAFGDPLLEQVLDHPGLNAGTVIVAMLFISPGRHAGRGGDVARICAAAEQRHPHLTTIMTELVGLHPALIAVLAARAREGLVAPPV